MSATDRATRAIQGMIRTGELKPGQQLASQRTLAAQLNVSRASLREALSTLEALGFLKTERRRGSFVTTSSSSETDQMWNWRYSDLYDLEEVYQFRALTEAAAIMLAATRMSDESIRRLTEIHGKYSQASQTMDLASAAHYDMEFHRQIMVASGNRLYEDLYSNFLRVFRESQMLPFSRHERRWEPIAEHSKILEALHRRDPEGASYYMMLHMQRATQRLGIQLELVGWPGSRLFP